MAKKITTLAPSLFCAAKSSSDKSKSFPIIWDSGASICVTPDKSDFVSYHLNSEINEVKGLGGKHLLVDRHSFVQWSMHDENGSLCMFKCKTYYISGCKSSFVSTSAILTTYRGDCLTIDLSSLRLIGIVGDSLFAAVIVFNNPSTNLPTTTAYNFIVTNIPSSFLMCHAVSVVNENSINLNEAQEGLLHWYQHLGHLTVKKIQRLMRTGVLKNPYTTHDSQ